MATAEELLLGAINETNDEPVVEDKTFYIDVDTRTIQIPKSVTQLGVESDDDVKDIVFSVPRFYYGVDLADFNIYINYLNAKKEGDLFEVFEEDMNVSDNEIRFIWTVGRNAVAYKGKAIFNVCMKLIPRDENGDALVDEEGNVIVEKEFNTTIATLPVLEGLETGEEIAEQYVDILMQWEEALFGAGRSVMRDIVLRGDQVLETLTEFSNEQQRNIILKGDEVNEALVNLSTEEQRKIVLKGSEVLDAIEAEKASIVGTSDAVVAEGETQVAAIQAEGTEQLRQITSKASDVNEALSNLSIEEQRNITLKGSTVIDAIEAKETEVLNSFDEVLPTEFEEYVNANPDKFTGPQGPQGEPGTDGQDGKDGTSITILGSYSTEEELRTAHPTGNVGDGYIVAGDLFVWSENLNDWDNVGSIQGPAGQDGEDGVSPTVDITAVENGTTVTITDVNGTKSFTITNGKDGVDGTDGQDGQDGYTPVKGTDYFDGQDGTDGVDGVSPTVKITKVGKVTTITITDATGVHTATINDGVDGTGAGDMLAATYDTDGDGIVDNAAALGGVAAEEYALKTDIPEVTDTAENANKLGGVAAEEYALKSDIPTVPTALKVVDDGNGNLTITL